MKPISLPAIILTIFLTAGLMHADVSNAKIPGDAGTELPREFNFAKMNDFVSSLPASIENVYRPRSPEVPAWSHETLSPSLLNTFERIQSGLFGKTRPLKLKSCSSCGGYTDFNSGTIFIQSSYIEKIESNSDITDKQSVATFVIAHEFGHVIQGLSVTSAGMDLNGLPSMITASVGTDATDEILHKLFTAHAEVDAYGFMAMKRAGFDRFSDGPVVLSAMRVKDDRWNNMDMDTRASRIKSSLDFVWPQAK